MTGPQPRCVTCGRPRKRRPPPDGRLAGTRGRCASCTLRDARAARAGPAVAVAVAVAAPERPRLKDSDSGYRNSTGVGGNMTEGQLQQLVTGAARSLGLLVFHSTDPRRDVGPGFPDLLLAGPRGILLAELKSPGYRLSSEQRDWRNMLQAGGAAWRCWYPRDWASGVIEAELRAIGWALPG